MESLQAISSATDLDIKDMLVIPAINDASKAIKNFKLHNPYSYLYKWIQSLKDSGYSQADILLAFETNPATSMDRQDEEQVSLTIAIIKHALGQIPDSEFAKYCHPTKILDFEPVEEVPEGYLFLAFTPDGEDNVYFLVDSNVLDESGSMDDIASLLAKNKVSTCELILKKVHSGYPWEISNSDAKIASMKLTWRDFKKY